MIANCKKIGFYSELRITHFAVAKMSRKGLMEQDLSKLDVNTLTPLSPEVISRQATINIGKLQPF